MTWQCSVWDVHWELLPKVISAVALKAWKKLKTLPFCDATKPQKPWGCNEDLRWERKIEVAWQAMKWNESEKWTWHSHAFVPIIFFKFTSGNSELSSRINQAWRKKRVCPVGSMTKDVLFMCAVTPGMANPTIHDISKVMDNNKFISPGSRPLRQHPGGISIRGFQRMIALVTSMGSLQ